MSFYSLINEFTFKSESAYTDIILKEKISIILNFFIWMYLLSFLLWIRGVHRIDSASSSSSSPSSSLVDLDLVSAATTSKQTSSQIVDSSSSSLSSSNSFLKYAQLLQQKLDANSSLSSSDSMTGYSSSFELSVKSVCITHNFAIFLFKIFTFFMALLRLFTLVVNIFTSVSFHFKFRYEYYNAFRVSFHG